MKPKGHQNASKTMFGSKMNCFKNRAHAHIKSTFLKVGESVWELKIHPKKLREKIKNDIEKKKEKRRKKSINSDKNAPGSKRARNL